MKMFRPFLLPITIFLVASGCATSHSTSGSRPSSAGQEEENEQPKPHQAEVASKTANFAGIAKGSAVYSGALDAHDLAGGLKQVGQDGTFKGTVARIFETRDGDILILNFDANYRTALNAVLKNPDFAKFPDMKALTNKEVVVNGKFVNYQGRAEIILTEPEQIKLVQ
jgi:hypothetical protein